MIKGLSFNRGIFFIGKKFISCVYEEKGQLQRWLKPISFSSWMIVFWLVIKTTPLFFHGLILSAATLTALNFGNWFFDYQLPFFILIHFFMTYHFWLPKEMKKYHSAEHKVFSFKGQKSIENMDKINKASEINRFCSTNYIVIYYVTLILLFTLIVLASNQTLFEALRWSTYASSFLLIIIGFLFLRKMGKSKYFQFIFVTSAWVQQKCTTLKPEKHHLQLAVEAYNQLSEREYKSEKR